MKSSQITKLFVLIVSLFLTISFVRAAPHIIAYGDNPTQTRGQCFYEIVDKLLWQKQYWYVPNCAVLHSSSWEVMSYNSGDIIYVKWKNIKASAYPKEISVSFWNFLQPEGYDDLTVPACTLTMPTPTFTAGTSLNIPCYVTSATTISLNSYINTGTASVGIDENEVITDEFEWTLPSGWSTTTGQTGTFVSTLSINVISPASASATSISVRAKANTQYSDPKTLQITRNLNDFSVSGDSYVVYNSTKRYEVPSYSGVSYSWQLPTGWSGSSTTNYIDVTVGCGSGNITATMTGCNGSKSSPKAVTQNIITPYL